MDVPSFSVSPALRMPGYPFAELERRAAELRRQGKPLFDLSIGDPDLPPPHFLIEAIKKGFEHPQAHRYPSSKGSIEVREAIAKWYEGRFGISIDPEKEVTILIGAKEGLAQLARAFIALGERVAFPDPGYPVYRRAGCFMLGGSPCPIPLFFENHFLPSIEDFKPFRLIYLNYPHNPTGAVATRLFLQNLSTWMSRNPGTIVAYDMAYGEMTFGEPALSLLAFNRSGVEFHSLSKMANVTGYRIGFAIGHPDLIAGIVKAKEEMDSGAPLPLQLGLKTFLESYQRAQPPEELVKSKAIYQQRREKLIYALTELGFKVFNSPATFYVWFFVDEDEKSFLQRALDHGVLLTPGSGFGEQGRGWVRASVTAPDEVIDGAIGVLSKLCG